MEQIPYKEIMSKLGLFRKENEIRWENVGDNYKPQVTWRKYMAGSPSLPIQKKHQRISTK